MKFRASNKLPLFPHHRMALHHLQNQRRFLTSFFAKKVHQAAQARASFNGGGRADSNGGSYLVPGATVATILMLGALHARRLYEDKKVEEARERGVEFEFQPDVKEVPVWLRPYLCRAWARAFHSNLEEVALPLEEYASLQEFFVRSLKEGSRPIDPDPKCLISPVDGIVLRFGELKSTGAMIEQVKGFSYSVASLLGANSILPMMAERTHKEDDLIDNPPIEQGKKSWWRVSLASPRVRDPVPGCVAIAIVATTISKVVLEGLWQQGFMGMAAIGATNIGSIELYIEPELRTNCPKKKLLQSEPPEERFYEPEGVEITVKRGDEVAAFNMGSTVVLVFQAPTSESSAKDESSGFSFCVKKGERVRVGSALGRWHETNSEV
ncbi:hypothetical protein CDL15_Pgr003776 [Punica granatum]|uniref:Phosphatidylserine decarboxylase n=1 Tax=Punica granatum TaxID=22663 RepID=A0A218XTT7_PUNGR|nr:hypothetical protein CDL15_Pgr003776 [Punica granatum]